MARPPSDDPLIPLPVRLPTSTVERLRDQAAAAGCSLSDVLRSHLTIADAKPLGRPRPRQREAKRLATVSGANPQLFRHLASIGSNLNQLARSVNAGKLNGSTIECIQIIAVLRAIEIEIMNIGGRSAH